MQNCLANGLPFVQKRARLLLLFAVCALAVCVVALLADNRTLAQNSNTNANAQAARQGKRVTPLRGSETPEGSRVTVTADAPLNDYAAYKSGDRFYVVVPGAANSGGGASGVRGRGYSDVQTQRRGNDLVYSFKLQPGAKARVSQRFNRLDVVFDSPGGGSASAANTSSAANANRNPTRETPATPTSRNTATAADTATQASASDASSANAERALAEAERALAANAAARRRAENANAFNPVPLDPALAGQPGVAPNANATPFVSDIPPPDQIAQAQPPTVSMPAQTVVNPPTTGVPTVIAPTLGTVVARNWGWLALLLALMVGLGLFFATRGKPTTVATDATPLPTHADGTNLVAEDFEEREYSEPKVISSGARGGATVASATMLDSTAAAAEPVTSNSIAADLATGAAVAAAPAIIAAGVAGTGDDDSRAQDERDGKGREPKTRHIVAPATDAELDDAEIVAAEVRNLLAGDDYNGKIIESAGDHARTLVNAELVAALAGRDEARRTAAREAFMSYGYFDRATHDLQHARASAERASAARALGFVGSALATPALIRALTDKSPEVRRASVEALAELRDPAAVPALEARRKHEKRRDMPRQLITRAIAACAAGKPATTVTAPADTAATAALVAVPVAVAPAADVETSTTETTHVEAVVVEPAEAEFIEPDETAMVAIEDDLTATTSGVEETLTPAPIEPIATTEYLTATEHEPATQDFEFSPVNEAAIVQSAPMVADVAPLPIEDEPVSDETVKDERGEAETVVAQAGEPEVADSGIAIVETTPTSIEIVPAIETISLTETVDAALVETIEVAPASDVTLETPAPEPYDFAIVPEANPSTGFDVLPETAASHDSDERVINAAPDFTLNEEVTLEHTGFVIAPVTIKEQPAPDVERVADVERFSDAETPVTTSFDVDLDHAPGAIETPAGFDLEHAAIDAAPRATDNEWFDLDINAGASLSSLDDEIALAPAQLDAATLERNAPSADSVTLAEYELEAVPVVTHDLQIAGEHVATENYADDYAGIAYVPAVDTDEDAPLPEVVAPVDETFTTAVEPYVTLPREVQTRLLSHDAETRARGVADLARVRSDESVQAIYSAFDDSSLEVRAAAARALHSTEENRANAFTQALREATPERRRNIGQGIAASGLADEAINNLAGESREKTYEAFSLLFLMAKAGEYGSLLKAIEQNPNTEVRLAVVKLLALSGQPEVLPAFRRLAVRGSLPAEVRSAVMEAIYQVANQGTASAG